METEPERREAVPTTTKYGREQGEEEAQETEPQRIVERMAASSRAT